MILEAVGNAAMKPSAGKTDIYVILRMKEAKSMNA